MTRYVWTVGCAGLLGGCAGPIGENWFLGAVPALLGGAIGACLAIWSWSAMERRQARHERREERREERKG